MTSHHQTLPVRRRRKASLLATLIGATLVLSSCTSVRNSLGTRTGVCFKVIPEARAAVGSSARFDGVRAIPPSELLSAYERAVKAHVSVPDNLADNLRRATCLVAFRGSFSVTTVKEGWAPRSGPYRVAIVVLLQSDAKVIVTGLFKAVPLRFAHYFAFER
jgi:hypothetical protein